MIRRGSPSGARPVARRLARPPDRPGFIVSETEKVSRVINLSLQARLIDELFDACQRHRSEPQQEPYVRASGDELMIRSSQSLVEGDALYGLI